MNDFLTSLKADLTDRRLLPAVALVGVLALAALAYAVIGGGGGSGSSGSESSPSIASAPRGLAVTAVSAEKAVAETPDGVSEQRKGPARNPFAALPESPAAKAASAKTAAPSSSKAAGSSSGTGGSETKSQSSGGSSTASGGASPSGEAKPKPAAPKTVYNVALLFGAIPAGATPQAVTLTPYEKVKLQTPLPSAKQALLVYRGVTAKGKSAIFSVVGEAILHGAGRCLPEPAQCQAIALSPGQSEQLEYAAPGATTTIVYELRVVSIASAKASAARAAALAAGVKAGGQLLRKAGLVALPFLRYSSQVGVLVFAAAHGHGAHAARRHGTR